MSAEMETNASVTQSKLQNNEEPPSETNVEHNEEVDEQNGQNGKQESNKNENCDNEITELLGSVTTHNCPGTRFSARVIQKMKQDQTRPATPPNDREQKKEEKSLQKTPSNIRANKPIWTNLERNHFFDALNEYGKDFEAIGNYINLKLKRKNAIDKTTHQVRQHYYQSYHKICKYVKFSDEVKKPVQELYALINYGEMRRKLQFVTDKHFMKLKNLVYQGHITVRFKGKNIRVKTPSCKALRRINQLDDTLEDIRLPSKIEVILSPSNMETFGRLQTIAQNPRVRCMVPLHKKLINLIKTFQYKWRSPESRLTEDDVKLLPNEVNNTEKREELTQQSTQDTEICFQPKIGVTIHRPLLSITEHLSSVNICLSAYEERFGVRVRSESLCQDRGNSKRQRTDSGSEKRSPETKKIKQLQEKLANPVLTISDVEHPLIQAKSESSSDELNDEIVTDILSDNDNVLNGCETAITSTTANVNGNANNSIQPAQQIRTKRSNISKPNRGNVAPNFKPLLNPETIRRIRQGWTVSNAGDITIGDLYVVLGQESRLELEYYWTEHQYNEKPTTSAAGTATTTTTPSTTTTIAAAVTTTTAAIENVPSVFTQKQTGIPYNPTECNDPQVLKAISKSTIGNKLKHLLLIANLSERIRKRQCSCGHICERSAVKTRIKPGILGDNYKSVLPSVRTPDGGVFRQPNLPIRRPLYSMDPVKQLAALSGQKMSRQVLVQRLLLPGVGNTLQTQDKESEKLCQVENQEKTLKQTHEQQTLPGNLEDIVTTSVEKPITYNDFQPLKNLCSFAGTVEAFSLSSVSNQNIDSPASQNTPTSTDSAIDDCSNVTSLFSGMSPMHLLRETTSNSRWLEENFNDFSLTSLLGHLDEINGNRDIVDPSNLSVISESSVDYMHKFQEISALMQRQDKD